MTKPTLIFSLIMTASLLSGCSMLGLQSDHAFSYKDIPIAKNTTSTGDGATILFKGAPMPLSGHGIKAGEPLPPAPLAQLDLSLVNIQDARGTVRIISVVPSLDTKVCEQQTHYLSEKNQGLDQQVKLITISVDTPFAQNRFAQEAGITNIEFLSDFRGGEFGTSYGLLLQEPHILARAVMVVDANNVIRHLQVTPDLGHMPDMDKAFDVARALLQS